MESTKKTPAKKPAAAKVTTKAKTGIAKVAGVATKPAEKKLEAAKGPQLVAAPTHEEISQRAYEIWMRHGGRHGNHGHDWALAEQELRRA